MHGETVKFINAKSVYFVGSYYKAYVPNSGK